MKLGFGLVVLLLAFSAQADMPYGRVFFTPAERAALEKLRQNSPSLQKMDKDNAVSSKSSALREVKSQPFSLQGYVRRQDGKGTVWVNGRPMQEQSTEQQMSVGKLTAGTNSVPIKLSNGKVVKLNAGQHYDPDTGRVTNLQTGNVVSATVDEPIDQTPMAVQIKINKALKPDESSAQ